MKARFRIDNFEICLEYPNCKCKGHYVYERNKKGCEKPMDAKQDKGEFKDIAMSSSSLPIASSIRQDEKEKEVVKG